MWYHYGRTNYKFGFPINNTPVGVFNASNYGKDSDNGYTYRPADGYDGHVGISMSGNYNFKNNGDNARRSVVFHELAENFYRTHFGYDYHGKSNRGNDNYGAHYRASMREGNYFGNSRPGGNIRFSGSVSPVKDIFPIINNHYRGF